MIKKEHDEKVDQPAVSSEAVSKSSNLSPLFASMLDDHSRTMFTIRAEPISCLETNPAYQDCQYSSVFSDYDEAFEAGEHFT